MATKVKLSNKKGPIEYPKDHQPGMKVPQGGSSCRRCEYLRNGDECSNEYYQKWAGTNKLPFPADEYCSDWFESA